MAVPRVTATDVEAIRAAALKRVSETSLRFAAREVGISATTLSKFIEGGSRWNGRTIHGLRLWYQRQTAGGAEDLTAHTAMKAIERLLGKIPPGRSREAAAAEFTRELTRIHERFRTPVPPWLKRLQGDPQPRSPGPPP